jgi:serine/threonine protein kinase/Flp pilus assembly protein TadD
MALEKKTPQSISQLNRLNRLCDRFERAWREGSSPRIEDFLAEVAEVERAELLRELLSLEIHYRRQRGELPTADEYLSRFPQLECAALEAELASDPSPRQSEPLAAQTSDSGLNLASPGALDSPPGVTAAYPSHPAPGMLLAGRYKLIEEIGEGGMGTVFMAQQLEPVKRLVAVKIIKPGMDSREVLARFEAERQALALMDHPNIARVLDAGTTDAGRPFFIMELVKGMPITRLCDEHKLDVRKRLELFLPVCQAIQHAHQKGIIHRDIKPSNVLVAMYDDRPVPKVIDFGLAKATEPTLTDKTLFTRFGAQPGTLLYMSPEQASLNNMDIDTRSDVYSLGVLLYELLTGTTPVDRRELQQAAEIELLRMVREVEAPRPSAKLSSSDALPSIAANRSTDPARLTKLLQGEIDWVLLKALEKDRGRRYETANGLARDLQRYLADEIVEARPPSSSYRLRKFVRRNRSTLMVAAVALFLLVLASGAAAWVMRDRAARQARESNDLDLAIERVEILQRDGKHGEARAALDNAELLAARVASDLAREAHLADLKDRLAADARDQEFIARFEEIRLEAQSRVDVERSRFTKEAAFPEIRDALRQHGLDIGSMAPTEAAARIQGRPGLVRRELIAALQECLYYAPRRGSESQWLLDTLAAADNDVWRVRARKALLESNGSVIEQLARDVDVEAQPVSFLLLVANAIPAQNWVTRLELFQRIQRAHPADLWANHELAGELQRYGRLPEAIAFYTAALALRPNSAGIYLNRGAVFLEMRRPDDAIADSRAAIRIKRDYAEAHNNLGDALKDKGQRDEAIAAYRQAIRLKKDLAEAHYNLGNALPDQGRLDEAIDEFREAIRLNKDWADAHYGLGRALREQGRLDEAVAEYREAIRLKKDYAEAHNNLGNALEDKGQRDKAIDEYREAIRLNKDLVEPHINLGNDLHDQGRLDAAIAELREVIRLNKDDAIAHLNLGSTLCAKGVLDEGIAEYREAIRLKKDYAEPHYGLGNALHDKGEMDEAIAEYREAIRLKKDYAEAHCNLGNALHDKGEMDEAIAEYREAIRLEKDLAEAHCNLGLAFRDQGRFVEALAELQMGHELGSRRPGWPFPSADWVRQVKELIEIDGKVANALKGKRPPESASERLNFALFCQTYKQRYATAAAWYSEAFAMEPKAADNLKALNRYNAARAAALAGSGRGRDADKLKDDDRAPLRRQALDWLRADLSLYAKSMQGDKPQDRTIALNQLKRWQHDDDLVDIRDPAALEKLPADERAAFLQLWADVEANLRRFKVGDAAKGQETLAHKAEKGSSK